MIDFEKDKIQIDIGDWKIGTSIGGRVCIWHLHHKVFTSDTVVSDGKCRYCREEVDDGIVMWAMLISLMTNLPLGPTT